MLWNARNPRALLYLDMLHVAKSDPYRQPPRRFKLVQGTEADGCLKKTQSMTDKTNEAIDERAQPLHGAIEWRTVVIIGHV